MSVDYNVYRSDASPAQLRLLVAQVVNQVAHHGDSLSNLLPMYLPKIGEDQASLFQALVYGSIRQYFQLRKLVQTKLKTPLRGKEVIVESLLIVGLYQILYSRIKEHAAINETVNACDLLNKEWAKGLINAVLRDVLRDKDAVLEQIQTFENFPKWLVKRIKKDWPKYKADIFEQSDLQAPMSLRLSKAIVPEEYLQDLEEEGIDAQLSEISKQGIRLENACDVLDLPGFEEGLISVQDEAAQLAGQLLPIKDGDHVLDACCAPGGKSIHLLQQADISLVALDQDERRMARVHENLERANVQADCIVADASDTQSWFDGKQFDAILLDAPCSATGVIRRHPDIKLLRRDTDIEALAELQKKILDSLWPLLKTGGYLLYATCSILKRENEQQMNDFLYHNKDAKECDLPEGFGIPTKIGRQMLPNGHDGFYYALLQKIK
ncbi:16S rRNA (cytosine(967)-C(5))-methyltransferase RsmB [Marinicellulosiphila megalodicopiae]|uniref:16S rRNA (cytosine(967)-C(5))-methyltransferase RsmB n=1 Tax=Marinicellulosiphila megalodicopiae TaxID=2724896 RepID=UPI003BAE7EF1